MNFSDRPLATPSSADEGCWTFNNFPSEKVEETYGFLPSREWLDHVQLSSLRTPALCSASFISDQGLVLTNHHCVVDYLEQLSTAAKDYLATPFVAKRRKDEVTCPGFELNQLVSITDVTDKIRDATASLSGDGFRMWLIPLTQVLLYVVVWLGWRRDLDWRPAFVRPCVGCLVW